MRLSCRALIPFLGLLVSGAATAAPDCLVPTGPYLPTQLPYTYALDRRDPHKPDYLERYKDGMPWLLETGQLTAGHPYFGPCCDQAALRASRPEKDIADFVRQYRDNSAKTRAFVQRARAAGCGQVLTYICMMTTGGDPVKRTGFWRFYDNWGAFREFGLPPRPADDPETWQQRKEDGSPYIAYQRAHPPYAPMFRWTNCVNNPGWRTYQRWVTEEAARNGVDGFFVDNANTEHCYCPHCQAKFAAWLKARYTQAEQQDLFGSVLTMAPKGDPNTALRKAEVQLFWFESIHNFLADIRTWGAAIHGSFFVFPNGLQGRDGHVLTDFRDCDLAMHENSSGDFGGNAGVVRVHVLAGLHVTTLSDHLLAFKYAAGAGARCRANMYSYPGYPRASPDLEPNPNTYVLDLAEPAAFGGGGCYAPTGWQPWMAPIVGQFNRFYRENAPLYRHRYPFGQVAIAGFLAPSLFGEKSLAATGQALQALAGQHVLADIVPERVFTTAWLARYPALVLPACSYVSDAQLQAMAEYARRGGKLIVVGRTTATRDGLGRPRADSARAAFLADAVARYDTDVAEALASGNPLADSRLCPATTGRYVRFAAYVNDPATPTDLVLHCVNYDVDLGRGRDRVGALQGLALTVPLPPRTKAKTATLKVPGAPDLNLPVRTAAGRALLTVPQLRIYAVLHLTLEREG